MRAIFIVLLLAISGCSMTPTERKVAYIAGGVVVASLAISYFDDDGYSDPCPSNHWSWRSDNPDVWTCVN